MNTKNKLYYLFTFLLGFTLSLVFGSYLATLYGVPFLIKFQGTPLLLSSNVKHLLKIMLAGAFGGLLYSLQNGELKLPYTGEKSQSKIVDTEYLATSDQQNSFENQTYNYLNASIQNVIYLGVIADCLIGIGGALVVFLILPGREETLSLIQFLGTAIIGGYGGRSLLNQAIDGITKRQDKIEKQVNQNKGELDATKQELDATKKQLKAAEDQAQKDGETLKWLNRYLDKSLTLPSELENRLIENIKSVSTVTRTSIFRQTQLVLYQNAEPKPESPEEQLIKNTLQIFIALRDSDRNHNNDRYPAHAAYAYMNLKEWSKAIDQLEEAKKKLEDCGDGHPQNIQDAIVYDWHLVICKIKAEPDNQEVILNDLRQLKEKLATLKPPLKLNEIKSSILKHKNPILLWLKNNNFDVDNF